MKLNIIKPKQALNKAFLKVKPVRKDIETFKTNLIELLDRTNDTESEEFHKNLVADFLKKTYYDPDFYINTKGRQDLVIHNGSKAKDKVGVILETKKPTNKSEMLKAFVSTNEKKTPGEQMISENRLNVKAFQELVLYYLRERITEKNLEVKFLIVTNINEWFIFNAADFEQHFAQNKSFVKQFEDFENGSLSGTKTDFFYKEIAAPAIDNISGELECTYFNIRDYEKALRNDDLKDDKKLVALFKLLSPQHVLKQPFTNDSNSLDKRFYAELLHIIGLTEEKDGSKKLIQRQGAGKRNRGSLLEDAILQLDSLDKISRLEKPSQFGVTNEERLFNVGLELCITWVNRILFLKLLEAQLQAYHNGDSNYTFLNSDRIRNYDDLNTLFFQVLARKQEDRNEFVQQDFANIPYLNSSLFEPTELEHDCFSVTQLNNSATIPVYSSTVLKDNQGKRRSGEMNTLDYFFAFLNAYDFSGEGSEDIQEDNKTLINASVLGLIFEKINGYKDGSFFTPGFITMYMCRETIRKAVIQKFNESTPMSANADPIRPTVENSPPLESLSRQELVGRDKGEDSTPPPPKFQNLTDIYNAIGSRGQFSHAQANDLINSIKICDPAVGSGHFLVSSLNEIIAIKYELGILHDRQGKLLRDYDIHIENDELIITDYNGELFEYHPSNRESQRVQETLFHEKQTIIENCLFGVDINPNSVKICRLRLWIELLKNAYYELNEGEAEASPFGGGSRGRTLQTLPNIDINIKCGNSLISRFDLDADLSKALRKSKWNIDGYRVAVQTYRQATNKEQKREMERLIADIKGDFRTEISQNSKEQRLYNKLSAELYEKFMTPKLLDAELNRSQKSKLKKEREKLEKKVNKLKEQLDEIKDNKIYENAFEWRFEFPEVLDDDGKFVGFDVVIGNPPYGVSIKGQYRKHLVEQLSKVPDYEIYYWFIDRANQILRNKGVSSYIIPNSILFNVFAQNYRMGLFENWYLNEVLDCTDINIFEDATVRNIIFLFTKSKNTNYLGYKKTDNIESFQELSNRDLRAIDKSTVEANNQNWGLMFKLGQPTLRLIKKIKQKSSALSEYFPETSQGLIAYDKYKGQSQEIIKNRVYHTKTKTKNSHKKWLHGGDVKRYDVKWNEEEYIDYSDGIANPRDPKFFIEDRILIREITNPRIFAAYTKDEMYNDPSVLIIKSNSEAFHIKVLLGLLNSNLLTFYHFNTSPKATKGAFPKILVNDINNFPIPVDLEKKQEEDLLNLVDEILAQKQVDPTADTTKLEQKIDQLVYALYGLTEEEIEVVENS